MILINKYNNYLNFKQIAVSFGRLAHTHILAEIKAWPSERIISQEQALVKRFGYKGYNLVLAHALSREIGGFTVPDFEIVEIGELWEPFYEANREKIDEIIRINKLRETFIRIMVDIYRRCKTKEERREEIRKELGKGLSILKGLFKVSNLEELERKIDLSSNPDNKVYLVLKKFRELVDETQSKLDGALLGILLDKYLNIFIANQRRIFFRTSSTDEDTRDNSKAGKYASHEDSYSSLEDALLDLRRIINDDMYDLLSENTRFAFILQKTLYSEDLEGGVVFSNLYGDVVVELGYSYLFEDEEERKSALQRATTGKRSILIRSNDNKMKEVLYNAVSENGKGLKHIVRAEDGKEYKLTVPQEVLEKVMVISKEIEKKLGYPVDIEFGVIGEDIYIVQIRPVTASTLIASPLPVFNEEDVIAEFPVSINQGSARGVKIVYIHNSIYYLNNIQEVIGYDQKVLLMNHSQIIPEFISEFLYGDQIFWASRSICRIAHGAISQREKGRDVIMGYFGDMENLKKRFGPMAEIEVSGKTAYISEGTFDIYSNGNKAVLVKAGAVPVFPL